MNLRRFFAVLLIALAATGVLMADSIQTSGTMTADVDLTLNLSGETLVGWHKTAAPTVSTWDANILGNDADEAFESTATDKVELWAAVKSNENVQLKMEVSGEALNSAKVGTVIGLSAEGEGGDAFSATPVEWASAGSNDGRLSMQEADASDSTRVFTGKITFAMDVDDFGSALAADDYSADITLTVSTVS